MKESHLEDLANHKTPESCAGFRKEPGEALIGARAGRPMSHEITRNQSADGVAQHGRQHIHVRHGKCMDDSAWSMTPRMYGNSIRENREILWLPTEREAVGCAGKNRNRNPAIDGQGKSDGCVVPTNAANKQSHKGLCGVAGGKAFGQGKHEPIHHPPDTEPEKGVHYEIGKSAKESTGK